MSLAFMMKAYSSQDCRRIRILSIALLFLIVTIVQSIPEKNLVVELHSPRSKFVGAERIAIYAVFTLKHLKQKYKNPPY